jgi:hypothetical protein
MFGWNINPISQKIAVSSSMVWVIGWIEPRLSGRAGKVTSTRSCSSRASSSASPIEILAVSMAVATSSFKRFRAWPASRRWSGSSAPSPFIISVIRPLRPSAETRSSSSASTVEAFSTAPINSSFKLSAFCISSTNFPPCLSLATSPWPNAQRGPSQDRPLFTFPCILRLGQGPVEGYSAGASAAWA